MDHRNLLAAGGAPAPAAPLLAMLALAALLGLAACQRQAQDASAIPHTPIPKAEARLSVAAEGGRVRYEGVVADAATRDAVVAALDSAAPDAAGTVAVEPRTKPAAWTAALGPATAALRRSGGRLTFTGRRIELDGDLTQEQRATLYRRIHALYPGYALAGAFQGADLRHALPEEGDMDALLAFLNARPLEFHPGSGMLTQASVQALARAARGLQAAGPAARVEVHVHPEAGGDAAEQRAAARQRADAVLTQLALRGVAPARLRAVVAAPLEGKDARVVEFAPFRSDTPADGDDPAADADAQAADDESDDGSGSRPAAAAEASPPPEPAD